MYLNLSIIFYYIH